MVKIVLFFLSVSSLAYSQTNTFPATGNAGVGNLSPELPIHVIGDLGFPSISGTTQVGVLRLQGSGSNGVLDFSVKGGEGAALQVTNRSDLALNYALNLNPNGGNIGIGITAPYDLLHIGNGGNIRLGQTTNTASATSDVIFNTYRDVDANFVGARLRFSTVPNTASGYPSVWKTGEMKFITTWGSSEVSRLVIKADGKVGIATENPLSDFQINDGSLRTSIGQVPSDYRSALGWAAQYIGFNISRETGGWSTYSDGINNGASMIMADPFGKLRIVNISSSGGSTRYLTESEINQNTKFIITPSGDVGVGTTSLDAKLTVKGSIHSEEVKVDLSVPAPDYVFEKNYNLLSLDSTKAYIDRHKHLPEVPSGKEMETNGVNLGEMNMVLLKKVEELTLYMIELKKQNDDMKTRLTALEEK